MDTPIENLNLKDYFCCSLDDSTETPGGEIKNIRNSNGLEKTTNAANTTKIESENSTKGDRFRSVKYDLQGVICHIGESLSQVKLFS